MADFDCIKPCIVCPAPPPGGAGLGLSPNDPNNPFNNLSSEAPDVDLFIGRRFTPPGLGNPPLGSTWFSIGCLGFAFSSVSQQDADLVAQQQAVLCTSTEWPLVVTPNPNPNLPPEVTPRPVFFSAPASCDFTCPDGSIFTYSVPAGFFFAFSQVAANAMAESFACNRVVANRSCFGPAPTSRTCLDAAYASFIAVASANLPITFTIQSGSLPPGISAAQSPDTYLLSGTPNLPGDYTFLLRATDSTTSFVEKQISISVFGIINTSPLAVATVGDAYSETLAYAGTPAGTPVYSIVSGALPDGLTLNSSTGEISGTPTTEQEASFVVRISDDTIACDKPFQIQVEGAAAVPKAWWTMDAGTPNAEVDAVSGLVLAQIFGNALSFTSVPGVVSNALQLSVTPAASAGSQCVNAALAFDGTGATLLAWVNISDVLPGIDNSTLMFYNFDQGGVSYAIIIENPGGGGDWTASYTINTILQASVNLGSAAGWHFLSMTLNAATGEIVFDIDRASSASAFGPAIPAGAPGVAFVLVANSAGPNPAATQTSIFDELALFGGVLSSADLDFIYNAGAGRTYPY